MHQGILNYFDHADNGAAVHVNGLKGVSRRAYRSSTQPFFERVERMIGTKRGDAQRDVIVISRKNGLPTGSAYVFCS